jgi:hypothetical protein
MSSTGCMGWSMRGLHFVHTRLRRRQRHPPLRLSACLLAWCSQWPSASKPLILGLLVFASDANTSTSNTTTIFYLCSSRRRKRQPSFIKIAVGTLDCDILVPQTELMDLTRSDLTILRQVWTDRSLIVLSEQFPDFPGCRTSLFWR